MNKEIIEFVESRIAKYKEKVAKGDSCWKEFEESCNDGSFDGANNWFGHHDDCFEKGHDYGVASSDREILDLLSKFEKLLTAEEVVNESNTTS